MYKIIGGDQKEYGPVTADELRRWIAEGRLGGQSLVRAEGEGGWLPLASYPEFAEALQGQPSAAGSAGSSGPVTISSADILAREPQVQIGRCLSLSWQLLQSNFAVLFGAVLIYWAIGFACQITLVTRLLYALLGGVFSGGLYLVFLNRIRGRPAVVTDVFAGFKLAFAQLLLAGFISHILAGISFWCCLFVPGIYLFVAWTFSVPLVADQGLEFWSAMELSRKVVTRVWFPMLGLLIVAFLPFLLVSIIVQTILLVTGSVPHVMPDWSASNPPDLGRMIQEIRRAMSEASSHSSPLLLIPQFVLLLNLPFAVGALMYAYEDLFGTRPSSAP
jgi:GYF domain 2